MYFKRLAFLLASVKLHEMVITDLEYLNSVTTDFDGSSILITT